MTRTCRLSLPLERLLDNAQISPRHLNAEMEKRIRLRQGAMRFDHPIPRRLMRANDVEIDFIRRRSRTFLFEINDRRFIYRERSRHDCVLIIPASLPETLRQSAVGDVLEEHVDLAGASSVLRGSLIIGTTASWDGSTAFVIEPAWVDIADPTAAS
jgi:hypothetical protein